MRFVIYDDDTLEPVTVLNIRGFTERDIERHDRRYRIPVPEPINFFAPIEAIPTIQKMRIVDLFFEPFRRRKIDGTEQDSWICFTKATELAMLLNPDWLPGQRGAVNYLQSQNDFLTDLLMGALALRT
jgi:hypothetical protein